MLDWLKRLFAPARAERGEAPLRPARRDDPVARSYAGQRKPEDGEFRRRRSDGVAQPSAAKDRKSPKETAPGR